MSTRENQLDEPLLPFRTSFSSSNDPLDRAGCCKATTVILIVLFVCGVLALGLSAIVWKVYDDFDGDKNHTTTTTPVSPVCNKRIVGFFSNHQTKDITKIQLEKLTHAVFSYMLLFPNGTIQFKNDKARQRFSGLKNKARNTTLNVKLLISIGGPDNFEHFSEVIMDPKKQRTLTESIISFLKEQQTNGVDIFWKWPKETDKFQFTEFLKNLKETMKEEGNQYTLSITAPAAGIKHWTSGFDVDEIVEVVDFINVLTMDYYGPWLNEYGTPTGPIAPLYSGVGDRKNFNVDYTMHYYSCETKQPEKFNIVIPFFGRLWKNVKGAVEQGKEAFRDVHLKDNTTEGDPYMSRWTVEHEGWKITPSTWDEDSKSSYIYDADAKTYLTFENERSLTAKMNFVKEKNLGGVWIWAVDMDDVKNSLLNTITSDGMCSDSTEDSFKYNC
ncbi:hypothetical protein GCK72_005173 [Caenorhabditis remanei]|uniref:GH18 domain-containing protein n=1 Tax=Caenorhabditis remanei TaxID=31234 RepID=A0A6A5HE95_CAERE|nr:hypothetical protein GCK72_005173 [Caenorhabditis remanei]KAF1765221.1 hypothetical protein GCK72_005173 [Caenorhabditis remanei]